MIKNRIASWIVRLGKWLGSNATVDEDYVDDLKRLARKYKSRRREIAISRIERFAAMLYRQIKSRDFDIVIAPGNSGLVAMEISKIVYDYVGCDFPEYHVVPVYRDGSRNAPTLDIGVNSVNELLFVDDEIMTGTSAKWCIQSVLPNCNSSHMNATIIAESHHFEWHYRMPGVFIYFFPYARSMYGLTNNVSFLLDDEPFEKISKVFPVIAERKQVMALMLSGKVKDKDNDGLWYFNETIEQKVSRRTSDYRVWKRQLVGDVSIYVKSGIEKYKDGEIVFPVS